MAEEAPKDLRFPFAFGDILADFTFSAPEQQQTRGQLKPWTGSSINLLPVGASIKAGEPQVWIDSCLAVDQLEITPQCWHCLSLIVIRRSGSWLRHRPSGPRPPLRPPKPFCLVFRPFSFRVTIELPSRSRMRCLRALCTHVTSTDAVSS